MNGEDLFTSTLHFLEALPAPIWTLIGVLIGGIVTLRIEYIKSLRRRRAISEVVFSRLHSLLVNINNLFVGGSYKLPILARTNWENHPLLVHLSLFSQSTLPAYRISKNLTENLFTQEKHITGVSWILSKLEVAEDARERCISTLDNPEKLVLAWYQYCIALSDFAGGCSPHMMTLYDLSSSPLRRLLNRKKRKRIKSELRSLETNIEAASKDLYKIFTPKSAEPMVKKFGSEKMDSH